MWFLTALLEIDGNGELSRENEALWTYALAVFWGESGGTREEMTRAHKSPLVPHQDRDTDTKSDTIGNKKRFPAVCAHIGHSVQPSDFQRTLLR